MIAAASPQGPPPALALDEPRSPLRCMADSRSRPGPCLWAAEMLASTVEWVNSALKRARASLEMKLPSGAERLPAPASDSPSKDAIVAKFVAAYESGDLDSLVALLTDDVFISMPPLPFEYQGREPASRFFASIFGSGRKFELLPTRANGQPAVGAYVRDPTGISHGSASSS